MKRTHSIPLNTLLTLSLLSATVHAQAPAAALPERVLAEHDAAMAAYERGHDAAALLGFRRAYAALTDPLADRAGRDLLLGALRSTWARLHARTGDILYLCAWRSALQRHIDALTQALGPAATPEDTDGLLGLLEEVDAALARAAPATCEPPSAAPASAAAAPTAPDGRAAVHSPPEPLHPPHPPRTPRRIVAGQALVGLGLGAWLGTGAALVVLSDRERRIRDLDAALPADTPASAAEAERVRALERQGERARLSAVITGVAGATLMMTGIALWATGRRARSAGLALGPVITPSAWGLTLRRRF